MSNNIIQQFDGTDEEPKLNVPRLNVSNIEQAPSLPTDQTPNFLEAIGKPTQVDLSGVDTPYSIETPDTSTIDFGPSVKDVATQQQDELMQRQQMDLAHLGNQLEDTNRFANYYPTLFEGPTSLDLVKGGDKVDALYQGLINGANKRRNEGTLHGGVNLSGLPQTRTDPNQFRPDSTANALQGFLLASGIGNLVSNLGPGKADGVNAFKNEWGDYGRGNLAAAMYGLNLPFQAVWGAVNDVVNQRNKFVDWVGTLGGVGKVTKDVLNWNPITELDKFVNKNVPDHKPISLFHDNNVNDSDFLNALRGKSPQSFSNYRDDKNSFIGIRMNQSYNSLRWYQDPSFWAGMAMDVLLDPSDLLMGWAGKSLSKSNRAATKLEKQIAKTSPKLSNEGVNISRSVAEGVYTPPPLGKANFPQEPLRAPTIPNTVSKGKFKEPLPKLTPKTVEEPLRIPVNELPDFMRPLQEIQPKVKLPELKPKPKVPPEVKRPLVDASSSLPDLSKPLPTLTDKPLPKLEPKKVPSRVFVGELKLSEIADQVTGAKPGTKINPTVLNKQRRNLQDLEELAKHVPDKNGFPIVPKDAPQGYFKTWKQLTERVQQLGDPTYQRMFAQLGPKIPVDELKSGNYVIQLMNGDVVPPPTLQALPEVKVPKVFDLTRLDPKYVASKGTPSTPTLIDQAKEVKKLAQEVIENPKTRRVTKQRAQGVIDEANQILASPDVVEPVHRLTQQELKKQFLEAANNAPRPGLQTSKPREKFVVKVKPNPDAVKTYQRKILPSEQHTPDISQMQSAIEARRQVTNISDEVRQTSLELRSIQEIHDNHVKKVLNETPDIGRQITDPVESPAIPNELLDPKIDTEAIPDTPKEGFIPQELLDGKPALLGKVTNDGKTTLTIYHGSRIQHSNNFMENPILGGTRSELGPAHHFTTNLEDATTYAKARIANDLPGLEGRAIGSPTVYSAKITLDKTFLNINEAPSQMWINAYTKVAGDVLDKTNPAHRQIYKIYENMNYKATSLVDLYHHMDVAVTKVLGTDNVDTQLLDTFQRKVNSMLQQRGINGLFGTLPNGQTQVSLLNGRRLKEINGEMVGSANIDDAMEALAERFNADSLNAANFDKSLLNKVKFEESKALSTAQMKEQLETHLENLVEEQSVAIAKHYEQTKQMEIGGKAAKQKKLKNIVDAVNTHDEQVKKHLDNIIDTPCSM